MKKQTIATIMFALFCFCFAVLGFTGTGDVAAKVIDPYDGAESYGLQLSYSQPNLSVTVTGGGVDYQYQFWVKRKIVNDLSQPLMYQYQWDIKQAFSGSNTAVIALTSDMITDGGMYNIIVRVKNAGGAIVDELFESFTKESVMPVIKNIKVNGKTLYGDEIFAEKDESITIVAETNMEDLTYNLLYNGEVEDTSEDGEFALSLNGYDPGFQQFGIIASDGVNTASISFTVFVYEEYPASEIAVIESLEGVSDNDGDTVFTMKLKYADNTPISEGDKGKFEYLLKYGKSKIEPYNVEVSGGYLEAKFNIDFNGKHGIYQLTGSVSRNSVNMPDDIINIDHYFARPGAYVNQSAQGEKTDGVYSEGKQITITANGDIPGAGAGNLQYAFFREDAGGWVKIKGYSSSNVLNWTPVKGGTYRIQARIMDANGGSYEATISQTYKVAGVTLSGALTLNILDYQTKSALQEGESLIAGRPYILNAEFGGAQKDLLYMFTLYTDNLQLVYLNKFTTDNNLVFVPNKPTQMQFSARVISVQNYGYKDISLSKTVDSAAPEIGPKDVVPHKIGYFDEKYGAKQLVTYNENAAFEFVTDVKYGDEAGSTKVTVIKENAGYSFARFSAPYIADVSTYEYIVYRLYNAGAAAFFSGVETDAGWANNTTILCNPGVWTEIKVYISNMANPQNIVGLPIGIANTSWGSPAVGSVVYLSAMYGYRDGPDVVVPDKIAYFDDQYGLRQVEVYNSNADFEFVSDVKYGTEVGSLKVTITAEGAGYTFARLVSPYIKDVTQYTYIVFYVYNTNADALFAGVETTGSWAGVSPVCQPGVWTEIKVPTANLSSAENITNLLIGLSTMGWASPPVGAVVYLSAIYGVN